MGPLNPPIVLTAFACELYLKALLLNDQKYVKGHYLNELFEEMSLVMQKKLCNYFKNCEYSYDEAGVKFGMENVSEIFTEIRYSHERNSYGADIRFLGCLVVILNKMCIDYCIDKI